MKKLSKRIIATMLLFATMVFNVFFSENVHAEELNKSVDEEISEAMVSHGSDTTLIVVNGKTYTCTTTFKFSKSASVSQAGLVTNTTASTERLMSMNIIFDTVSHGYVSRSGTGSKTGTYEQTISNLAVTSYELTLTKYTAYEGSCTYRYNGVSKGIGRVSYSVY